MHAPERHKEPAGRPSLLSSQDQNESEASARILDSVSSGDSKAAVPGRWRGRMLKYAALGISGLLGAMLIVPTIRVGLSMMQPAEPILLPITVPPGSVSQSAAPAAGAAKKDAFLPPQTASIVNENMMAEKPELATTNPRADRITTTLEANVKPLPSSLKTALEAVAVSTVVVPAIKAPLVRYLPATKKGHGNNPAHAQSKQQSAVPDSDLGLIVAMTAYTSAAERPSGAKKVAPATAAKAAVNAAPSSENNTQELLQQCKKENFISAEICRWKTCSDKWSSDAACQAR